MIALFIYLIYNIITIGIFGIPKSLSETFYLYKNKKECLKIVFPLMIVLITIFLFPIWIKYENNFQFLIFLSLINILFTGFSSAFRSDYLDNKIHNISAICSAIFLYYGYY